MSNSMCCVNLKCCNVYVESVIENAYKTLVWLVKIIGLTALLILTLWLTLRPVPPSCYITRFHLKTFDDPDSNLISLKLVVLNQDVYKGIHYDTIMGRITFPRWDGSYGVWLFNASSLYQWPGTRKSFTNDSVDFTLDFSLWKNWLPEMMRGEQYFVVKVLMVYRYRILFWTSETKLTMKSANIYFTNERKAFIPSTGLSLQ